MSITLRVKGYVKHIEPAARAPLNADAWAETLARKRAADEAAKTQRVAQKLLRKAPSLDQL